jgi:hypothetical protein
LDSIIEAVYRVAVPILYMNSEIWLRLFLVFCLLDLLQIFSVVYVFCSCYCLKFWYFNVKLNLNNLSYKILTVGIIWINSVKRRSSWQHFYVLVKEPPSFKVKFVRWNRVCLLFVTFWVTYCSSWCSLSCVFCTFDVSFNILSRMNEFLTFDFGFISWITSLVSPQLGDSPRH